MNSVLRKQNREQQYILGLLMFDITLMVWKLFAIKCDLRTQTDLRPKSVNIFSNPFKITG